MRPRTQKPLKRKGEELMKSQVRREKLHLRGGGLLLQHVGSRQKRENPRGEGRIRGDENRPSLGRAARRRSKNNERWKREGGHKATRSEKGQFGTTEYSRDQARHEEGTVKNPRGGKRNNEGLRAGGNPPKKFSLSSLEK